MRCPHCKNTLPIKAILMKKYICKQCNASVSTKVIVTIFAAIAGIAVSIIFSAGYRLVGGGLFLVMGAVLFALASSNLKYTLPDDDNDSSSSEKS